MSFKKPIYFDYSATTPVDPRVVEAMLPYFTENFGNPESTQHAYGWKAKSAIEKARAQVAKLIGGSTNEIVFTSGATESINLAIFGYVEGQEPGRHLITSAAEHKATLEAFSRAEKLGHEVTILPVNRYGQVELETLKAAIRPNTVLVSLMHANNEVGSFNPIAEIGAWLKSQGETAFHVDAAQTVGKHPIDVKAMNIDLLSLSAHKMYGPKGVGALFINRQHIHLSPLVKGGGQERGLRGGTHNVPGIVGFGVASEIALNEMPEESRRLASLRDRIIKAVVFPGSGIELNGHPNDRLCNNVHLSFHVGADDFLMALKDFAFSTASACSAGGESHVLKAMGASSSDPLFTSARFSLGRFTTDEEVDQLIACLRRFIQKDQVISNGYVGGKNPQIRL